MALQYGNQATFTVTLAGPFGGSGSSVRLSEVTLKHDAWKGGESPYFQEVQIDGVSKNTMVNLHPSAEQVVIFHEKDIIFTVENDGGNVTVFCVGDKPTRDYTIQASLMEVTA